MTATKLTAKQERFAQLVATGSLSQAEAYRRAYAATGMTAKSVQEAASRLARNSKVAARVEILRKPAVEAAGITFAGHLARLHSLSILAQGAEQYSAAIAAEVWRGKVASLYTEKVRTEDLDKLTEDELEEVTRGKVPTRLKLA